MSFEFKEITSSLSTRIDIHNRFGKRDLNQWILQRVGQADGCCILDVGCGLGTQCVLFAENYDQSRITGVDISTELLKVACQLAREKGLNIDFIKGTMDEPLPFETEQFDLVTCCFAVYYAQDIRFSIGEMQRVLKTGGRIFLTGPTPNNKPEFFDLQLRLTGKPTPFMPGRMRFEPEGLAICRDLFTRVDYQIFENPLVFYETAPFVDYVRASVTEDRILWRDLLPNAKAVEHFCDMVAKEVSQIIERDGEFIMNKVVGGILGYK